MFFDLFFLVNVSWAVPWSTDPVVRADAVSTCGGFLRTSIPFFRIRTLDFFARPRAVGVSGPRENPIDILKAILPRQIGLHSDDEQPADTLSFGARKRVRPGDAFFEASFTKGADIVQRVAFPREARGQESAHLTVRVDENHYTLTLLGSRSQDLSWKFTRSGYLEEVVYRSVVEGVTRVERYRPQGTEAEGARGMRIADEFGGQLVLRIED